MRQTSISCLPRGLLLRLLLQASQLICKVIVRWTGHRRCGQLLLSLSGEHGCCTAARCSGCCRSCEGRIHGASYADCNAASVKSGLLLVLAPDIICCQVRFCPASRAVNPSCVCSAPSAVRHNLGMIPAPGTHPGKWAHCHCTNRCVASRTEYCNKPIKNPKPHTEGSILTELHSPTRYNADRSPDWLCRRCPCCCWRCC